MTSVSSDEEFAKVLRAHRAILFVDFAWSGQAKLSAALVQEWERTLHLWNRGVDFLVYRVRPDDQPFVASWLKRWPEELQGEGGYGSLVWLRSGWVVGFEPYAAAAGIREIARRTQGLFRPDLAIS
jgi:hypothetical protein